MENKIFKLISKGIKIETNSNHDNCFMIRDINDSSSHGNIGLYSIASYDSQFTLKHYYNLPLCAIHNSELTEIDTWIIDKWDQFCKLKQINLHQKQPKWIIYTNIRKTTPYPKKGCTTIDFLHWLENLK